jgi:hypothetical protein
MDDALAAVFPYRVIPIRFGSINTRSLQLASDCIDSQTARDFIMGPSWANSSFFEGFVRFMTENDPTWDVIALQGILEDSIAVTALKNSPQLPILWTVGGAWGRIEFISCSDNVRPFQRLSKGFKQNLRTAHNKLDPGQVTFEVARTESDLTRLLPEFLRVESSGWKGEAGSSALKTPPLNMFLRQLISQFGPSGRCEIHLMRLLTEPIATLFGIVADGIWYIFRIGYSEAHHMVSPGHLIIENLLRTNDRRFDTLAPYNAPPWFRAWKPDKIQQIFNAFVFRPSPAGINLAREIEITLRRTPNI